MNERLIDDLRRSYNVDDPNECGLCGEKYATSKAAWTCEMGHFDSQPSAATEIE